MAASDVAVCNIALQLLGADVITSLNETTKAASLCNTLFADVRDETLRDHEWNFAQKRAALAAEVTLPLFGYAVSYVLPTDPYCLRVNEVEPEDAEFSVEGRHLLTNETTLNIRYTARVTAVTEWDASFTLAMALKLAAYTAKPLTGDRQVMELMEKKYQQQLAAARTYDSQEGSRRTLRSGALVDVRFRGARIFRPIETP